MPPHRRLNALNGEWVLVSPQRTIRPWRGQIEPRLPEQHAAYDPACHLCPGNARASGEFNPSYATTFAFTNDFAALLPEAEAPTAGGGLLQAEPIRGTSRVLCFSPRHDLTLAEMSVTEIAGVIDMWCAETATLGRHYRWVQVFENKGPMMGCSNPHPHGQVWALDALPTEPQKEDLHQLAYAREHARPLLLDYLEQEINAGARIVAANEYWVALVPFWATWPFELLLLPRKHVLRLPDLTVTQRSSLSETLKQLLVRYDNLFSTSFPYSMGWHGAPYGAGNHDHWQLHAHFFPPLLRSATVKKFMVGFEMLAEAQRDTTPEAAAARLRELSTVHYKASPVE